MIKKFLALSLLTLLSCGQQTSKEKARLAIIEADLGMNELASREGFFKALLHYAADSVVIPREGKLPLFGKPELAAAWLSKPVITSIYWKPYRVEVAEKGDMGFSFGFATFKEKDTVTYTNYCTIWKKQADGSWKFLYDGGNNIPQPDTLLFNKHH